jgi:hypothetical protein
MMNSRELAKLVGPTIVVMTISEMINFQIWQVNIPSLTYLNGMLLFVAGISIIRVHNYWSRSWPVMITLVGWIGTFGGLFRIFFPQAKQASNNIYTYIFISVLLALGMFLTFKAYSNDK